MSTTEGASVDSEEKGEETVKVCTFFKRSGRRGGGGGGGRRKRPAPSAAAGDGDNDDDAGDSDDETSVVRAERRQQRGGLVAKSGSKSRKVIAELGDQEEAEEEAGSSSASKLHLAFKSARTAAPEGPQDMGATATLQTETEHDRDARAVMERADVLRKEMQGQDNKEDKVYRGQSGYDQYIEVKDNVLGSAASRKGPQRAPAHLRATVRWDYQPDICKDYKETGYCGFGDTCKFLHDRSDYKSGWQLDQEWEQQLYGQEADKNYEVSDEEDDLPFACYICREKFTKPVVTRCQHYFCEKCALSHFRKSKRCYICNQPTGGMFNPALEILEKIKRKEEEIRQKAELPEET